VLVVFLAFLRFFVLERLSVKIVEILFQSRYFCETYRELARYLKRLTK
jgi:hypothetical protein